MTARVKCANSGRYVRLTTMVVLAYRGCRYFGMVVIGAIALGLAVACVPVSTGPHPQASFVVLPQGQHCADTRQGDSWREAEGPVGLSLGQIVLVALTVPQRDEHQAFAWSSFVTSDTEILASVPICQPGGVSVGLSTEWAAFTATATGTAFLTAEVSPQWYASATPAQRNEVQPIRIEVDVR